MLGDDSNVGTVVEARYRAVTAKLKISECGWKSKDRMPRGNDGRSDQFV